MPNAVEKWAFDSADQVCSGSLLPAVDPILATDHMIASSNEHS
jgi:hypothetical protein